MVWDSTKRFRQAFYFLLSENGDMIPYPADGRKRAELAKMAGVSHDTIAKVEKIVASAAPEVVEAARRDSWRPCATLMQTKGE